MMAKALLIVGAGQYGQVVREVAMASGRFERIAFLDDNAEQAVGKIDDLRDFVGEFRQAIIAIGNAATRQRLSETFARHYELATLIHPRAHVSPSATLGEGCCVEAMAVVNTGATVGRGTFVCAGAVINHNATVEGYCQIDCGAVVAARAQVPAGMKVQAGTVFSV